MKLICNYAVARLLPHSLTGEFVNIGVVMHCRQTGFLDFRVTKRHKRTTDFFPELTGEACKAILKNFREDLAFACKQVGSGSPGQLVTSETADFSLQIFKEIIRPRESLLQFGSPATVLTEDPEKKLDELLDFYVERNFAETKHYQESVMNRYLSGLFREKGLGKIFEQQKIGNKSFEATFPLVQTVEGVALKAIKPLDLAKETPTLIYDHGDQWVNRITRLKRMGELPRHVLFPISFPKEADERLTAAREIEEQLTKLTAVTVSFEDQESILKFARNAA